MPDSVISDNNGHPEEAGGGEKPEDGPSELELLALELSNQLAKDRQRKQQAEEAELRSDGKVSTVKAAHMSVAR